MSMFFADTTDQITLGVQASNQVEVTQFSSTTDEVFMRLYTNNYTNTGVDNLQTGVVIGSSNYDKSGTNLNNLYLGMVTGYSNLQKSVVLQKDRVGINTSSPDAMFQVYGSNVYSNWSSLARFEVVKTDPLNPYPAFVIDANGNVGFGTNTVAGNTVTVKGTLQVDSLQIGAAGSGGSPSLITTQGLQAPAGTAYLQYNNTSFCNVKDMILNNSLYTSNTVFANNFSPFIGSSSIYYSGANLSNISIIYPQQIQFTSQGTASSPALTFQTNANTGIFEPSNNNLAISTSGTEALRVNQNGNVGIGSQSPTVMLDVAGTIASPMILGSNIIQTFTNVANFTFVNGAKITIGVIPPTGNVPITLLFNGNSTQYTYTLKTSTGTVVSSQTINNTATAYINNYTFSPGTYSLNLTSTTPGVGAGSFFNSNAISTFTVGATDSIGQPNINLSGTPTFSSGSYIYVSGVPYYGYGTTLTFPVSSLTFTNIYNTINPTSPSVITNVVIINGVAFTYSQVFTNFLVANSTNNNTLSVTLNSSETVSTLPISATVYNINYQGGYSTTLISNVSNSGILYLGSAINETYMNVATYPNMPITSVVRQATSSSVVAPAVPAISNLTSFTGGNTISTNDGFYSPYTGFIYSNINNVPRGTYAPTLPNLTGSHSYFSFLITTTAALGSFVINFNSANTTGITNLYVYWVSLGNWYNAKYLYTNTGNSGCGASTYTAPPTGDRYPITLPQGTTLSAYTNIYVSVQFNGSIDTTTLSITNS